MLIRVFHPTSIFVQYEYKCKQAPRVGDRLGDPRDAMFDYGKVVKVDWVITNDDGDTTHEVAFVDVTVLPEPIQ